MADARLFRENYGRLESSNRDWDVEFWQAAGPKAIFQAAWGMIRDYHLLKHGHVGELRIQRTVEHYGPT